MTLILLVGFGIIGAYVGLVAWLLWRSRPMADTFDQQLARLRTLADRAVDVSYYDGNVRLDRIGVHPTVADLDALAELVKRWDAQFPTQRPPVMHPCHSQDEDDGA